MHTEFLDATSSRTAPWSALPNRLLKLDPGAGQMPKSTPLPDHLSPGRGFYDRAIHSARRRGYGRPV